MKPKLKIIRPLFKYSLMLFLGMGISCEDYSDKMVVENEAVAHFRADSLLSELAENNIHLTDKLITVHGFIAEINQLNNRNTLLLSTKENGTISIICDMQKTEVPLLEGLEKNQPITIKGILKGTLKDVILLNCIIAKPSY